MAGKPYHDQFKSQHVGPGFNIKVRRTSRTMRGGQGGPLPGSRICPADRLRPDGALPAFPPSPWVLCSLPCLQRTPVSADGSRVQGRTVTHAFPSRPLSPRPQRHTPRPFQTDSLFPPSSWHRTGGGVAGPQAENPRNPRTGSWDSRGGLFILPEVSLGSEALDRTPAPDAPLPAPGESPPHLLQGSLPHLLRGSRLRPEARLGVSAGGHSVLQRLCLM